MNTSREASQESTMTRVLKGRLWGIWKLRFPVTGAGPKGQVQRIGSVYNVYYAPGLWRNCGECPVMVMGFHSLGWELLRPVWGLLHSSFSYSLELGIILEECGGDLERFPRYS